VTRHIEHLLSKGSARAVMSDGDLQPNVRTSVDEMEAAQNATFRQVPSDPTRQDNTTLISILIN
jgi:hypothetical protein